MINNIEYFKLYSDGTTRLNPQDKFYSEIYLDEPTKLNSQENFSNQNQVNKNNFRDKKNLSTDYENFIRDLDGIKCYIPSMNKEKQVLSVNLASRREKNRFKLQLYKMLSFLDFKKLLLKEKENEYFIKRKRDNRTSTYRNVTESSTAGTCYDWYYTEKFLDPELKMTYYSFKARGCNEFENRYMKEVLSPIPPLVTPEVRKINFDHVLTGEHKNILNNNLVKFSQKYLPLNKEKHVDCKITSKRALNKVLKKYRKNNKTKGEASYYRLRDSDLKVLKAFSNGIFKDIAYDRKFYPSFRLEDFEYRFFSSPFLTFDLFPDYCKKNQVLIFNRASSCSEFIRTSNYNFKHQQLIVERPTNFIRANLIFWVAKFEVGLNFDLKGPRARYYDRTKLKRNLSKIKSLQKYNILIKKLLLEQKVGSDILDIFTTYTIDYIKNQYSNGKYKNANNYKEYFIDRFHKMPKLRYPKKDEKLSLDDRLQNIKDSMRTKGYYRTIGKETRAGSKRYLLGKMPTFDRHRTQNFFAPLYYTNAMLRVLARTKINKIYARKVLSVRNVREFVISTKIVLRCLISNTQLLLSDLATTVHLCERSFVRTFFTKRENQKDWQDDLFTPFASFKRIFTPFVPVSYLLLSRYKLMCKSIAAKIVTEKVAKAGKSLINYLDNHYLLKYYIKKPYISITYRAKLFEKKKQLSKLIVKKIINLPHLFLYLKPYNLTEFITWLRQWMTKRVQFSREISTSVDGYIADFFYVIAATSDFIEDNFYYNSAIDYLLDKTVSVAKIILRVLSFDSCLYQNNIINLKDFFLYKILKFGNHMLNFYGLIYGIPFNIFVLEYIRLFTASYLGDKLSIFLKFAVPKLVKKVWVQGVDEIDKIKTSIIRTNRKTFAFYQLKNLSYYNRNLTNFLHDIGGYSPNDINTLFSKKLKYISSAKLLILKCFRTAYFHLRIFKIKRHFFPEFLHKCDIRQRFLYIYLSYYIDIYHHLPVKIFRRMARSAVLMLRVSSTLLNPSFTGEIPLFLGCLFPAIIRKILFQFNRYRYMYEGRFRGYYSKLVRGEKLDFIRYKAAKFLIRCKIYWWHMLFHLYVPFWKALSVRATFRGHKRLWCRRKLYVRLMYNQYFNRLCYRVLNFKYLPFNLRELWEKMAMRLTWGSLKLIANYSSSFSTILKGKSAKIRTIIEAYIIKRWTRASHRLFYCVKCWERLNIENYDFKIYFKKYINLKAFQRRYSELGRDEFLNFNNLGILSYNLAYFSGQFLLSNILSSKVYKVYKVYQKMMADYLFDKYIGYAEKTFTKYSSRGSIEVHKEEIGLGSLVTKLKLIKIKSRKLGSRQSITKNKYNNLNLILSYGDYPLNLENKPISSRVKKLEKKKYVFVYKTIKAKAMKNNSSENLKSSNPGVEFSCQLKIGNSIPVFLNFDDAKRYWREYATKGIVKGLRNLYMNLPYGSRIDCDINYSKPEIIRVSLEEYLDQLQTNVNDCNYQRQLFISSFTDIENSLGQYKDNANFTVV